MPSALNSVRSSQTARSSRVGPIYASANDNINESSIEEQPESEDKKEESTPLVS